MCRNECIVTHEKCFAALVYITFGNFDPIRPAGILTLGGLSSAILFSLKRGEARQRELVGMTEVAESVALDVMIYPPISENKIIKEPLLEAKCSRQAQLPAFLPPSEAVPPHSTRTPSPPPPSAALTAGSCRRDGDIGAVDIDERDGLNFVQMHQISLSFTGEPQNIPAMGVRHANRLYCSNVVDSRA